MKKLMIMLLLAAFVIACTKTEIQEADEYAIPKSKSVSSQGDGSEFEMDNTEE